MSKKKPMTHKGVVVGSDARAPNYRKRVFLRELKNHWVTEDGVKFSKNWGSGMGQWPIYSLDLESVEPLTHGVE